MGVRGIDSGEIDDLGTWVEELAKLPLVGHPGANYDYGYSYDVLGHLVKVKTGLDLPDYLDRYIFKPLGMCDTCFDLSNTQTGSLKSKRLAALYRYTESVPFGGDRQQPRLVRVDPLPRKTHSRWELPCKVPSGGGALSSFEGGLLSTLDDYAKFLLAVTSGGAHPT